jgi:hypothetical protein
MGAADLTGQAREVYDAWRGLGHTDEQALQEVRRAGLLPHDAFDDLVETFRRLGLPANEARRAAVGRDGSEHRVRQQFKEAELAEAAESVSEAQAVEAAARAFAAYQPWLGVEGARDHVREKLRTQWAMLPEAARKRNLVQFAQQMCAAATALGR